MSIHGEVNKLCLRGRLRRVLPLMDETAQRHFYATPEVYADLDVAALNSSAAADLRRMEARAVVDSFVAGRRIDVRMKSNDKRATLALLRPNEEGLWELRIRTPRPGVRIFGGFIDTDVFVALKWVDKGHLVGDRIALRHRAFMQQADTEWVGLFAPRARKTGGSLHDYVSRKATLLDRSA